MAVELRGWRDEAAAGDWADARPIKTTLLVIFLTVVGELSAAPVLAGNGHVAYDLLHDVAALSGVTLALR
jgi:hypothetical protein